MSRADDVQRQVRLRQFPTPEDARHIVTYVALDFEDMTKLTRFVDPRPFVPANDGRRAERCEEVLSIQAHGLATRLAHTGSQRVVVGISGGLDSTLALLVTVRAFDEGHPVRALGLVYPMLDHRTTDKSGAVGQFIWTAGPNRGAWSMYLGDDHLDVDLPPYASPATRSDLSGLPPTWIGVGGIDLFCDESVAFAQAMITGNWARS